ncbi:MAG: glycosyltransferase family 8 protein [Clostridia bacterium]|nr:glycosyltransferase family 8 protein [Clostridia bacterium]
MTDNNIKNEIPIFFTIDDNYAPFLATALNSAVKNSAKDRRYRAIILYKELSRSNMNKLKALATDSFKIDFITMCEGMETITDRLSNRLRFDCFTLTIYFRLFIPTMFPQYDKGIYIDSDVVLLGDIAELYDTDIGDNYIGACTDLSVQEIPVIVDYIEKAVGVPRDKYINSGVLLMNLKKLREAGLDRRFLKLLNKYHFDSVAPDQDYINALCHGRIHYLSPVWDAMPNDNALPLSDARLIHYNLYSKPWYGEGVQYEEHFWKYAGDSGFIDSINEKKADWSEEQREKCRRSMEILCDRASDITYTDVTFKNLYEKGEAIRL